MNIKLINFNMYMYEHGTILLYFKQNTKQYLIKLYLNGELVLKN